MACDKLHPQQLHFLPLVICNPNIIGDDTFYLVCNDIYLVRFCVALFTLFVADFTLFVADFTLFRHVALFTLFVADFTLSEMCITFYLVCIRFYLVIFSKFWKICQFVWENWRVLFSLYYRRSPSFKKFRNSKNHSKSYLQQIHTIISS